MARFTGTFIYAVEVEHNFEIEANNQEEASKKIQNDPLKYSTNTILNYKDYEKGALRGKHWIWGHKSWLIEALTK